jgi:hypothetical protein
MTVHKWSQTALTNASVDATINLRERQSPGSLNDSARAMMAAVAKFRDDISGNLVTTGTATALAVTTNQGFASLSDGLFFSARMNTTSGASPTLAVDGLTAKQIRSVYGTDIPSGALLEGGVYTFVYDSTDGAWIVGGRDGDVMRPASYADLVAIEALSGTTGALRKTAADTWALDDGKFAIVQQIGDGINVISTGVAGDVAVPFAATVTAARLFADTSGSIVVNVWKDTYANYPPTVSGKITASAPPTISAATKSADTTLTGWTTSITAGDCLRFNVDSVSSIKRATLILEAKRFI